ncbi:DDE-domain-containing protein [Zopfia rhizophila CBS 207.26]|uniref:DDE-domain-containing protein n=1 Tax=Zopfia rhizophila CBS 207.26 TaxID=1314779 RepID=A0A6A6DL09_9PEZI|nr:DDE-domain-containing protein [Zopfia rhizophila CBS 207.26]
MPAHSSHILQPLDVGCFSPLKTAYRRQVKKLMRNQFNHITKLEFLPAFRDAFDASITESNIQESFRGAGLVPFDLDKVILKLDVTWQSKIPKNYHEFGSQTKLITDKLGILAMAQEMVLIRDRVAELEAANKAASRQKQRKRKRIQKGGVLSFSTGQDKSTKDPSTASSSSKKGCGKVRADGAELT